MTHTSAPAERTTESPFDAIRRVRPDGTEYWPAREMQPLMGYSTWQKLKTPLARAVAAAKNQGLDVEREFSQFRPLNRSVKQSSQTREDYELSRMAAYLVAMNGDPNKPEVAAAQLYFAMKTREAEVAQRSGSIPPVQSSAQVVLAMAQQLVDQEQRLTSIEQAQAATIAKLDALDGRHDWFTALGYARLHGFRTERAYLSRVGRKATAFLKDRDQEPHPRQDATFGRVNTYPVDALEYAFEAVAS